MTDRTCARTPTWSLWRTTSWNRAGDAALTFTTFGTSPSDRNDRTIRTASRAIADCACSVDAPMWGVAYTEGRPSRGEVTFAPDVAGSPSNTSTAIRSLFFGAI